MWCIHFGCCRDTMNLIYEQRPPSQKLIPLHLFACATFPIHMRKKQSFRNLWYYSCLLCLETSPFYYYFYQIGGLIFQFNRSHSFHRFVFAFDAPFAWIYSCVSHSCVQLNGLIWQDSPENNHPNTWPLTKIDTPRTRENEKQNDDDADKIFGCKLMQYFLRFYMATAECVILLVAHMHECWVYC